MTHRPVQQQGGLGARWRSLTRYLPEHGWSVEVISARQGPSAIEFPDDARSGASARTALRPRVMGRLGRLGAPVFGVVGLRPEALPPSMLWVPRGALELRRHVAKRSPDAVLATGPPMAALLAARLVGGRGLPPLVVEMRDLWAGNPYYDAGGHLLGAAEDWVFTRARSIVAATPEAAEDLRGRHPRHAARIVEITNGFEPELLERRAASPAGRAPPLSIIHSGTLTPERPLTPLLQVLAQEPYRSRVRLVLHGYLSPGSAAEIAASTGPEVDVVPPSGWADAIERIAATDAALVTQGRQAGDATAVAAKVYEYLALGKPVLCLTDGGATEALLRRLGADRFSARLDQPETIRAALDRLLEPLPLPLAPERVAGYDRRRLAGRMAEVLEAAANVVASR